MTVTRDRKALTLLSRALEKPRFSPLDEGPPGGTPNPAYSPLQPHLLVLPGTSWVAPNLGSEMRITGSGEGCPSGTEGHPVPASGAWYWTLRVTADLPGVGDRRGRPPGSARDAPMPL